MDLICCGLHFRLGRRELEWQEIVLGLKLVVVFILVLGKLSQLLHQRSNLDAVNFEMGAPVVVKALKGGLGTIT